MLLFGQIVGTLLLRSSPSGALTHRMRYVGRLRKQCLVWANIPRLTRSLRLHPTESSQVRVGAFSLRLSASASGLGAHRHPTPPNNSFKPTPHRGVNNVLCATLHAVATPLRGGLTQALGGRKAFCKCSAHRLDSPASVGASFRKVCRRVATSSRPAGRARTSHALRSPASASPLSFVWLPGFACCHF